MKKIYCPFTIALILVNIIFFLYTAIFVPDVWDAYGASLRIFTEGKYYLLITAMFTHASVSHLFSNMIALYAVGQHVEDCVGGLRFLAAYMVCGLFGSVFAISADVFINHPVTGVGASGAIFGLFGIYIILSANRFVFRITPYGLVVFLLIVVIDGIADPGIDLMGHFTGMITGLLVGLILAGIGLLKEANGLRDAGEIPERTPEEVESYISANTKKAATMFYSSGAAFLTIIIFMIANLL